MTDWQTGFPPDSKPVLAITTSKIVPSGETRRTRIRAMYLRNKEWASESWDDNDGIDWYCEEDDCCYIREGWYELIHYWEDYSYIAIPDPVVAWTPIPELPESEETTE